MFSDLTFSLALCFSTCAHCCAKGSEAPSKWIVCDAVSTKLRWRLHQLWLLHAPQSPSGHRVGSCFCFTTAVSHLSGCHNHYVYGSGTSVLYGWQFRSSIHGDATHVSPKCALIVSLQTPKFEQQVIWAHIEQVLVIAWQRGLDARYWHCCDIKAIGSVIHFGLCLIRIPPKEMLGEDLNIQKWSFASSRSACAFVPGCRRGEQGYSASCTTSA